MIDKINANQIRDILEKSASQPANSSKTPTDSQPDASLHVDFAALIESAAQLPQTDADAVRRAQQLLASGQLESPENIRAAVENILEYGI